MRRAITTLLTAGLALTALAAAPADGYEPQLDTERVYAHCGDASTLVNLDGVTTFAMDATAPTASVQDGAGCAIGDAVLTDAAEQETGELLLLTGTHVGNLDSLTLDLYMIDAGIVRASALTSDVPNPGEPAPSVYFEEIWVDVELYIDGAAGGGWVGEAKMVAERTNDDATARLRMTLTGINLLAAEDLGEHTISVKIKTSDYYNGDSGAWVLDTTEVPTGVVFNPAVDDHAPFTVPSF